MDEAFFQGNLRLSDSFPEWLTVCSIVLILAFLANKTVFPRYWYRFRQALIYPIESQKLLKEQNINLKQSGTWLNVLANITIGLFVFECLVNYQVLEKNQYLWLNLLRSVFIISGLTLLKYLFLQMVGRLFYQDELTSVLNHAWLLALKNFGFFILPLAAIIPEAPDFLISPLIIIGIILLISMLIYSYIRGFGILINGHISILYGILYLCTLEILPILVILSMLI